MVALAFWDAIKNGLGSVLAFLYSVIPNSGVAIILLTVAVRLALFPLTAKQAKSMLAMQRVQPEIKKLQAKYKNDRQKLNEEMMKFYKENEINPLGGCLPLVLQMPVFIALYQTLRDIKNSIPIDSKMFADICAPAKKAAACKPHMSFVGGMDLTKSASQVVNANGSTLSDYAPYLVLVALVLVTGYLQQRQTMRNQTTPNPQMAIISKVFPIVFGFISWGLLSGVVLYFFTSNLWQIGQQEVVLRTIGTAAGPPPKKGSRPPDEGSEKSGSKTGLADDTRPGKRPPPEPKSKGSGGKPASGGGAKSTDRSAGKPRAKPSGTSNGTGQTGAPNGARSNRKRKR
ncbi:MAG: membrane protein insertase YidC [Acidimicrobiia bacterium]